jgi:hypothetical protein
MHPELIHQMALERMARLRRDAEQYRRAREIHIRPPQPVRTAIKLGLGACREELERLARRLRATGGLTE